MADFEVAEGQVGSGGRIVGKRRQSLLRTGPAETDCRD